MSLFSVKNNHKNRPKIQLEMQPIDNMLEAGAAIFLLCLIILPAYHFGDLPDRIPTHFNAKGVPDSFGDKGTIWILPIVGFIFFAIFTALCRFPHTFNYPVKITAENAERQYSMGVRLMRILKTIILLMFLMICYGTIQIAQGKENTLGGGSIMAMVALILGVTIFYFIKAYKK